MRYFAFSALFLAACVAGCGGETRSAGVPLTTDVRTAPWNAGAHGKELISAHYRIYTTSGNRSLVRYMPGFMEAAHGNYLNLTGLADRPDAEPMPVYLMATRQEWAALTMSVVGENARPYLQIQAGGYCYNGICVFWDIGNLGTFSVASHEGLHQLFHHRLRDRLPMWLEEGLCTQAEGYDIHGDLVEFTPSRNNFRFTDLRAALVQGRFRPLAELLSMDSGEAVEGSAYEAVGYYGQLWALVQFIRSDTTYRKGMEHLLADAEKGSLHVPLRMSPQQYNDLRRRGRAYNKAVSIPLFRAYISPDLAGFQKQYRAFAEKLAGL